MWNFTNSTHYYTQGSISYTVWNLIPVLTNSFSIYWVDYFQLTKYQLDLQICLHVPICPCFQRKAALNMSSRPQISLFSEAGRLVERKVGSPINYTASFLLKDKCKYKDKDKDKCKYIDKDKDKDAMFRGSQTCWKKGGQSNQLYRQLLAQAQIMSQHKSIRSLFKTCFPQKKILLSQRR